MQFQALIKVATGALGGDYGGEMGEIGHEGSNRGSACGSNAGVCGVSSRRSIKTAGLTQAAGIWIYEARQ